MNDRRRSKVFCYALIWIILTFFMRFSSGTICEKCGLDFPQAKKHIWRYKANAMERKQSTHQVTLDITLNDEIPHNDNQRPNGNNIVVNLNNEIQNIDYRSYDPHEQNNDHQCQCYCGKVFNSYRGLNTHRRTCYVRSIPDINGFLLAEGDEINLEMQEIAEESNIRSEHLPKGLIKQGVKIPRSIQE